MLTSSYQRFETLGSGYVSMDPHDFKTYVRGGILAGMYLCPLEYRNGRLLNDAILGTMSLKYALSHYYFQNIPSVLA